MASIVQYLAIAAVITIAYGQTYNVTNGAQEYFLISQRELFHDIEIAELKIVAVNDRYADRLDVITLEQDQVLNEIQLVNQTLMPLQALSVIRKHCIQKFDSKLITYNDAQFRLNACYNKAKTAGNTLTTSAESYVSYAKSYATVTLPKNVATCNSYSTNQTKLENCYEDSVETAATTVHSYLNTAQDLLEKSLFDSKVLARTAVQCSFVVEKDVLETIAATTQSIDVCESDLKKKNMVAVKSESDSLSVKNLIMGKVTRK